VIPSGRGDVSDVIPQALSDVAVLEEPEHLNWYNSGRKWTDNFRHVVGIAHTNYIEYALRDRGYLSAKFLKHFNQLVRQ
jgi:digalactosyldiacylglycerol synthase